MKNILVVFGTRPEAIKMCPLVLELKKYSSVLNTIVCVTGQHKEMLDQVLDLFEIIPDYNLQIMKKGQDLNDITISILSDMRHIFNMVKPDIVLVHGDTTTSIATALAAFYQKIPVGHIEAGLRTYNKYSPWPEEINRQLTSRIATYHFAPTTLCAENLLNENVRKNIFVTGNTGIDALYFIIDKIKNNKIVGMQAEASIIKAGYNPRKLEENRKLILITGHRRENFGKNFENILEAIKVLVQRFQNIDFVYPMHLNPNVRKPILEKFTENYDNLYLIEPLKYLDFVYLMSKSYLILTDSGGIQEEAPGLGKPVLVTRNTTERPEAIKAGTIKLVGSDTNKIVDTVTALLKDINKYKEMSSRSNPYGDGLASKRIVNEIIKL